MVNQLRIWVSALAVAVLQSCSVSTETTYYKDAATSMESNILMDQSMLGMMSMMGEKKNLITNSKELSTLSTEWKSLYDIQKDGKITLNKDSAKVLQKLFLKVNKAQGEIYGLSVKYDKLLPGEIATLLSQSKQL